MSTSMAWGFAGDFLSCLGGLILALDAILEERRLKKMKEWEETIQAPELANVVMTRSGVRLKRKDDVELSFVRQSTRRAALGAIVLAIGFLSLFTSRLFELHSESESQVAFPVDIHQ